MSKEENLDKINRILIGKGMKHKRLSLGLTQKELADRTNTQKYWLSNVESGKTNFRLDVFSRVLAEFNMDIVEFCEYTANVCEEN